MRLPNDPIWHLIRAMSMQARREHVAECVADLKALFAARDFAEWRVILAKQKGQWDVVQDVGELAADGQVQANRYIQNVDAEAGRSIPVVSVPMQFNGAPLTPRPAPDLGADSDAILAELGYDEDGVIALKIDGAVF